MKELTTIDDLLEDYRAALRAFEAANMDYQAARALRDRAIQNVNTEQLALDLWMSDISCDAPVGTRWNKR
jgi:hypothetical protein